MTVFVKTISDIVALILQSLRLAVFLPAAVFVGLNAGFILPALTKTRLYQELELKDEQIPVILILLFAVLLVSYVLTALNTPIIRFFEGYSLLNLPGGKWLQNKKVEQMNNLRKRIADLNYIVPALLKGAETTPNPQLKHKAKLTARACELEKNISVAQLTWLYPHKHTWRVLPTRLGNVIAAAEEYPGHLYGIDSVTFWPYLVPILNDKGYASFIEREKSILDFLLNMAVVTLLFGAESIYFDFLMSPLSLTDTKFWGISTFKLVLTIFIASLFYLWSIQGALSWGNTIRAAFVLYRHQLRQKLGLRSPTEFFDEYSLWEYAGQFYRDQDEGFGHHIFTYPPPDSDQAGTSETKPQ